MENGKTKYEQYGCLRSSADLSVYYARRRGKSHTDAGTVCQDYCLAETVNGLTVVCAADGHGGSEYVFSDLGAELACTALADVVRRYPADDTLDAFVTAEFRSAFLQEWKRQVLDISDEESGTLSAAVRKYGTTVLFAIVSKTHAVLGQLGDGAILMFNDSGTGQLLRRHGPKIDSSTSSMVSSRAEYALETRRFPRSLFPYIILSTDGIYDKLDTGDSFILYGQTLVAEIRSTGMLSHPFTVADIDVSEVSRDDCTAALIVSETPSSLYIPAGMTFQRAYEGITICSDGNHTVHCTDHPAANGFPDSPLYRIVHGSHTEQDGHFLHAYTVPEETEGLDALFEREEHLQKKDIPDDGDEHVVYTNAFWLHLYIRMRIIRNELRVHGILPEPHFFDTVRVGRDGTVYVFEDAWAGAPFDEQALNRLFDPFFDRFGFIGSLVIDDDRHHEEKPLYRCRKQSGVICLPGTRTPFCRLVRNPESREYGLWNLSPYTWMTVDERKIPPQKVLRLEGLTGFRCREYPELTVRVHRMRERSDNG